MSGNHSEGDEEEGVHDEVMVVVVKEDEIIRKIIMEMRKNSILHDISNPRYQKDRNKAIESTALKLKITPKLLRKKITYIKGQYTRQRDSLLNAKKVKGRSGDGLQDDFEAKKTTKIWKWFDECHFLDDVDVDDMVETNLFCNYGAVKVNTKGHLDLEAADLLPDQIESGSRPTPTPHHDQKYFEPIPGTSRDLHNLRPPSSPMYISSTYEDNHSEPLPGTSRDHRGSRPPSPKKPALSHHDQEYFQPVPGTSRDHRGSRPPPPRDPILSMRNQPYFEQVLISPQDHELPRPRQRSGILDISPNVDTDIIFVILNVVHSFLQKYSSIDQLMVLAELTSFLKDFDKELKKE